MQILVPVQALRALAALSVVICHFHQIQVKILGHADEQSPLCLASGVDLFFVISGFIMVYSSGDLFGAPDGARTFLIRRLSRIVLPYWIATLIAIPVMSLPADWVSLLGSLLFIPYRVANGNIAPIYGVGWTLNFEMYFYVLFSAAIFLRRNIAVPVLCLTLCLIVLLGDLLQPTLAAAQFWSDPIILEFAFGMVLALLYIRGVQLSTSLRICLIVAGIVATWLFQTKTTPSGYRALEWGIPATMIFAGTILGREIDFGRTRAVVRLLGGSSYALYLTHPLMSAAVILGWQHGLNQFPLMLVLFVAIIAVQLFSVTLLLFEKRAKEFLKQTFIARSQCVSQSSTNTPEVVSL